MTTMHGTGRPGLDEPVPYTLTPRGHAALTADPRTDGAGPLTSFPSIVCLCGSTRFYDEFRRANLRLTLAGQIVLSIGCDTKSDQDLTAADGFGTGPAAVKARLDDLHKRKIDLADYVLVLNVGGYVGESTRAEIAYAHAAGKPVRYLDPGAVVDGPAVIDGWACEVCGFGWFGTRPDDGLCDSCRAGAR
jgi:hypothetical protein